MWYDNLLEALRTWAAAREDICAVGIAGSYARGIPRPDSDVDVVILTTVPGFYLSDQGWLRRFGEPLTVVREDWGVVQSLRTIYADGSEIEFGIAPPSWASADPVDAGTHRVVSEGFAVVFERDALLTDLIAAVEDANPSSDRSR